MTDDLRADLDQLLTQRRHRPISDRLRRCQRAQEVTEIVGERMKLEANGIGGGLPPEKWSSLKYGF